MSCQGITSSAITRQGLLEAIRTCGPILRDLRIMVPWLPYSAEPDEPDMVIDRALSFCTSLRSLCVAGYDVSNSFTRAIPNPHLLRSLEIMDFELVTPLSVFQVASTKTDRPFSSLEKLAIWQRNAGVGRARVSNGWFKAVFGKETSPAIKALERANILLATGWESRLISGSDIGKVSTCPNGRADACFLPRISSSSIGCIGFRGIRQVIASLEALNNHI